MASLGIRKGHLARGLRRYQTISRDPPSLIAGRGRAARGALARPALASGRFHEVRGGTLLPALGETPAVEPLLQRSRQLFGHNPELFANLLGAKAASVSSQERYDAIDDLCDVRGRPSRQTDSSVTSGGRLVRSSPRAARSSAAALRALDTRLGQELIERRTSNEVQHLGGKPGGELAQAPAQRSGHEEAPHKRYFLLSSNDFDASPTPAAF